MPFLPAPGRADVPNYKKPNVEVNVDRHARVPTKESTVPLKDAVWRKKINDPILDQLIERARQPNSDTESALARVREARANASPYEADFFRSTTAT